MIREHTPEEQERIAQGEIEYQKLDAQRVKAMNSRDALKYSDLCTQLGVEPELPELIEQAEAERIMQAQGDEGRKLRYELETLANEIKKANNARTNYDKINWLRARGYKGARVAGVAGMTVNFAAAPERNVYALYIREKRKLEDRAREIRGLLKR